MAGRVNGDGERVVWEERGAEEGRNLREDCASGLVPEFGGGGWGFVVGWNPGTERLLKG